MALDSAPQVRSSAMDANAAAHSVGNSKILDVLSAQACVELQKKAPRARRVDIQLGVLVSACIGVNLTIDVNCGSNYFEVVQSI